MFTTPFLVGLASSLHCIGMCSPLVMAVSGRGKKAFFRNLVYNLGRIFTYGLLGSVIGFIGMGVNVAGVQSWLSIAEGIIILVIGIANIRVIIPAFVNRFVTRLMIVVKTEFKLSPILLGMINGILPCGMTLIALGYCITLAGPAEGFLAMIFFGLGTLPVMLGLSSLLRPLIQRLPITYSGIQNTLLILSAILLIGRGVSEPLQHQDHHIVVCGK